MDNPILIRYVI